MSMMNIRRSSNGASPVMARCNEVGTGRRAVMSKLLPEAPLGLGKPPIHGVPGRSHGLVAKQRRISDSDLSARKAKRLLATSDLPSCSGPGSISRRGRPAIASYRHSTTPAVPQAQHPTNANLASAGAGSVVEDACEVQTDPLPSMTAEVSPVGGVDIATPAPARSTSVTRSCNGSVRSHADPCTRSEGRPILVLDLDETLIHTVTSVNGKTAQVLCRPGLDAFLSRVSKVFDVVVFTAGTKMYADQILDRLDPAGTYFKARLYRESCNVIGSFYTKDLMKVCGREALDRCIIVDNTPENYAFYPYNGVPIADFIDDEHDRALNELGDLLCDFSTESTAPVKEYLMDNLCRIGEDLKASYFETSPSSTATSPAAAAAAAATAAAAAMATAAAGGEGAFGSFGAADCAISNAVEAGTWADHSFGPNAAETLHRISRDAAMGLHHSSHSSSAGRYKQRQAQQQQQQSQAQQQQPVAQQILPDSPEQTVPSSPTF